MSAEVKFNANFGDTRALLGSYLELLLALDLADPLSELEHLLVQAPDVVELVPVAEHLIELLGLECPVRDQCLGHFPLDAS
jgi:hypothetical protein